MRALIQRSKNSKVTIDGKVNGKIDSGYVIFVGFTDGDNEKIIDKMVDKIINLRIFEDENEKMNKSIIDVGGSILSISQFTLYANCKDGRRPSFVSAMNPDKATILYDYFNNKLKSLIHTETGIFGADMKVEIYNDGPVTIMLDSDEICKGVK
jgi:D-tyrosyl-tRNA(Tyr) deacylase